MVTVRDLQQIARSYNLPGRSKLKKQELIKAIAELRAPVFIERIKRAQQTGRYKSLRDLDSNSRISDLMKLDDETNSVLRAKKYTDSIKKKPSIREKYQQKINYRVNKPHLHGLTRSLKETLARAIVREGPDILRNLLDDNEYYRCDMVGWKNVKPGTTLFPHGDDNAGVYVKRGEDIDTFALDHQLGRHNYKLTLVSMGPETDDDGSIYWWSYEADELHVDMNFAEAVIDLLDDTTYYKLFTTVGLFNEETRPLVSVQERFQRITRNETTRGDKIKPGALHGIDIRMWSDSREYMAFVRYELRPLPKQLGEPGPMKNANDTEFANCFVKCVVGHFTNKMTKASTGLTKQREKILKAFDTKLATKGCTKEDMYDLEKALKVKLIAVDALGNTMWDSDKYNSRPRIRIPCHNNHAWEDIPTDPPKIENVYGLDVYTEIALAKLPLYSEAKTTAAKKTLERRTREILISFASRVIAPNTRLWLCGQSIVSSDGNLWRTHASSNALDRAFEEEHGIDFEALREEEGYIPPQNIKEIMIEYEKATHSIGGALSYRFSKWLEREGIKPTPPRFLESWRSSQVESKVWNSADKNACRQKHYHIDMRAAYLACEDSTHSNASDVTPIVRQYGFPSNIMRRAKVAGRPFSEILELTGTVQLKNWRFDPNSHPYIVGRISEHLLENNGWITTPELKDLIDSGDLLSATPIEIVYSVGKKHSIKFPNRDLGVKFVGKCARHGDESSILVRDENEAAYLCNTLGTTGRLINFENADGMHYIQYKEEKTRSQWFHIRAFVLAYTNINLRIMLRRFQKENVIRVCTDAIYVKTISDEIDNLLIKENRPIKYGQWRHKKPGYEYRSTANWQIQYTDELSLPPSAAPPLPPDLKAASSKKLLLRGQGGSAKTTFAVQQFKGRRLVVLVPEHDLACKHRSDERMNLKENQVQTLHHYLCINPVKPIEEWDPQGLGHRLDCLAEVIIIDECDKIHTKLLKRVLEYLDTRSCQVICAGDYGQIKPWGDKEGPHSMLLEWAGDNVRHFDTDYRCLCEICNLPWSACVCQEGPKSRLHTIKKMMWTTPDSTQIQIFRRNIAAQFFDNAIEGSNPADVWICSTNCLGAQVQKHLLAHHRAKYPHLKAKIRFDPDESIAHRYYKKQGRPVPVPGSSEMVPGYKGKVVKVPLNIVEKGLPLEWKYAGWGTVHRVQGSTIQPPSKIFIVDHALSGWIDNAVYTAVSRARLLSQIIRVLPPRDAKGPIIPSSLQSTPSREVIDAKLKRYVVDDNKHKETRTLYKGAHHKLTVDHVLNMAEKADYKCTLCGVTLLFQDYTRCHGQQFSIDRIDDNIGHSKDNVRLTCLSCNRRHKNNISIESVDPNSIDDGCQFW